jgi:hypothetical protein
MNIREKNFGTLFLVGVSTIAALTLVGLTQFNVLAQNATTTANQTGVAATNQTSEFGNWTSSWFDPVADSLAEARNALHANDPISAYSWLGSADIQLFAIVSDPATGAQMSTLIEQIRPMTDRIAGAQNELVNNDISKALAELNEADVEILRLIQQLPEGEPEEGEE